ncbi:hypothetical protein [Winogradskyella sediminis]|uniref:hypothetical protein n=1 Tax=Winogradskyella sediminis TaxID=1382466 RepID=UPI000E271C2B|nr:hypothetical protein [Winogradskyella sediminis]REG84107.1 hypothetical protein C8N41_1078 [Winogradskyella sediminis]
MELNNIINSIKDNFSSVWQTKQRGASIEIITPYVTTNDRFISVFLTKRGSEFIITDGGWVNGCIYDNDISNEDGCFNKILFHYINAFDIKETVNNKGSNQVSYYYVKTNNLIDIPSRVLDLATFIQNIVSTSLIEFVDKEEKEAQKRFVTLANDYIKSNVSLEKIKFNAFLHPEKKELKFNALYYYGPSEITLLNYITGSSVSYFSNSIFKANTLFEMADESLYKNYVRKKVTILDTNAKGYVPNKIGHYLVHLQKQTGAVNLEWSNKEQLFNLL